VTKRPGNPKKYSASKLEELKLEMQEELLALDKSNHNIIQIDESIFSGQDYQRNAWSNINDNVDITQVSSH